MQIADIDFCTIRDVDELYGIECACFHDPWSREVLLHDLSYNVGLSIYMKAVLRDFIAGYGVLGRSEDVACLMNLAVLSDYQGMGIGLQLMMAFDVMAAEWECRRMRLEVRASNRRARDFYARLGFDYKKRSHRYYADGEDALVYVARLPLKFE